MRERQYAGADWIKSTLKIENISPLGEAVADLLGDVFQGIYHLDIKQLAKVGWSNPYHIEVVHRGQMATFDDSLLTILVVLAHDRMIRVDITGRANHYLEFTFHQRQNRTGAYHERHPSIEDHITRIRNAYDHATAEQAVQHA